VPRAVVLDSGKPKARAGTYTANAKGISGFTVALHSLTNPQAGNEVSLQLDDGGFVDDIQGKIISVDHVSDSCFVEAGKVPFYRVHGKRTMGPLYGKTPRQYQPAFFYRLHSFNRNGAVIDSWSKDLPFVTKYNQLKVFTDLVANPGDSGSALISDDEYIIGFAFYNSGISSPVSFTAWIWAESVFRAHDLKWNN
jgi:hypothetical protein